MEILTKEILESLTDDQIILGLCHCITKNIIGMSFIEAWQKTEDSSYYNYRKTYNIVKTDLHSLREKIEMRYKEKSGFWWPIDDMDSRKEFIKKALEHL